MIGFLFKVAPVIARAAAKYFNGQSDVQLAQITNDTERLRIATQGVVETNAQKVAASMWWGARLIILTAGFPPALYLALIYLDSIFLFPWSIAKVPAPYDEYGWLLVQSFFILAPAATVASSVAGWLNRKR